MTDEKIYNDQESFIRDLLPEVPLVATIREAAEANHVPAIPVSIAEVLRLLVRAHRPKAVLEYGTGYGLSLLTMAYAMDSSDVHFLTLELDEARYARARAFFAESPFNDQIELWQQDFRDPAFYERLAAEGRHFDFVFVDASKGKYTDLLEAIDPFMVEGGLFVFDDVFQSNWVLDFSYPNHRQKTAVLRLRAFLQAVAQDPRYAVHLLAIDDGLLILEKKRGGR